MKTSKLKLIKSVLLAALLHSLEHIVLTRLRSSAEEKHDVRESYALNRFDL